MIQTRRQPSGDDSRATAVLSVIFHNRLSHAHALARFQSFCEEPMMYHVLHYCVAVFQDLLTGAIAVSRQPEMLWHKAQTIRLLHDSLLRVDESDLEVVICTVMYLTGSDLERHVSASTLLFRAHPGQATWTWIDGQKPPVKAHVDALGTLVAKRGGLLAIEMPGLALSIARSDLVYAALWLAKPRFPCFWSLDDATLAAYQEVQLTASQPAAAGLASIAGMLPFAVLDVLVHVAHTERLLMNHLQVFSLSEQQSEAARCIAHHRLLCLPAWDDTDGIHSEWADETVYECCRLTALLYSTAVILGLPAHVGWHVQLGAQIRRQLEACDVEELSGDAPGLLVWVLTIAAIAAVGSEGQAYFVEALREALGREGLQTRRAAEHVLEGYLWSVETCGEGMARVWEAMGLE